MGDCVLGDVLALSSGTLASLSGCRDLVVLDRLQGLMLKLVEMVHGAGMHRFADWQEVWQFVDRTGMAEAMLGGVDMLHYACVSGRLQWRIDNRWRKGHRLKVGACAWNEAGRFGDIVTFRYWEIWEEDNQWRIRAYAMDGWCGTPPLPRSAGTAIEAYKKLLRWNFEHDLLKKAA